MKKLLILSLFTLSALAVSAQSYKTLHKWETSGNDSLRQYVEAYYITFENPENNAQGEQDSIKRAMYRLSKDMKPKPSIYAVVDSVVYYKGIKGGIYRLSKSGKKVYVKDLNINK